MRVSSGAWLLLAAQASLGCAVNAFGWAQVSRRESESARSIRIEVWGVHLTTHPEDAGITLGHSLREYVFSRPSPASAGADEACSPLQGTNEAFTPSRDDRLLLADVATAGVAFDANATHVGASLGLRRRTVLRIEPDENLVLRLQFDSANGGTRCVSVRRL